MIVLGLWGYLPITGSVPCNMRAHAAVTVVLAHMLSLALACSCCQSGSLLCDAGLMGAALGKWKGGWLHNSTRMPAHFCRAAILALPSSSAHAHFSSPNLQSLQLAICMQQLQLLLMTTINLVLPVRWDSE